MRRCDEVIQPEIKQHHPDISEVVREMVGLMVMLARDEAPLPPPALCNGLIALDIRLTTVLPPLQQAAIRCPRTMGCVSSPCCLPDDPKREVNPWATRSAGFWDAVQPAVLRRPFHNQKASMGQIDGGT